MNKYASPTLFALCIICFSFVVSNDWNVPEDYHSKKNPTTANEQNLKTGKELYTKYCASCHGKTGLADGTMSKQSKVKTIISGKDYLSSKTDGDLFYYITVGKDGKHVFSKKIPAENDRWYVVNYMNTLK